jgi:hypothetical protein
VTRQVAGLIDNGGPAAAAATAVLDRVQPTVPILMANLVSVGKVAVTYHDNIEQLLVLVPHAVAASQAGIVANADTKQAYKGQYLSFNLNINLPPPCTTGFLPAQQRRVATEVDAPERAPGDLYCGRRRTRRSTCAVCGTPRAPGSPANARPTVRLCESDEPVRAAQRRIQLEGRPERDPVGSKRSPTPALLHSRPAAPAPPPIAAAEYDPATGIYIGPDGREYRQPTSRRLHRRTELAAHAGSAEMNRGAQWKLAFQLGYWGAQPPTNHCELVAAAERAGFDTVFTAEAWGSDAYTPLAWWGRHTSRMRLGTSVVQLSARTPTACAMAALTLDHLSGGRHILGLGVSGPQIVEGWYGATFRYRWRAPASTSTSCGRCGTALPR